MVFRALFAIKETVGDLEKANFIRVSGNSGLTDWKCGYPGCTTGLTLGNTSWFFDSTFQNPNEAIYTMIHEYGHIYDSNASPNRSDVFEDLFWDDCAYTAGHCLFGMGEPMGETTDYGKTNPAEDFAESFAVTIWMENFDISPASDTLSTPMGGTPDPYLPFRVYDHMPSQERRDYITNLFNQ